MEPIYYDEDCGTAAIAVVVNDDVVSIISVSEDTEDEASKAR
jgi:hypothetical protein